MTYILGARCKDGVVLIGDRRVSRGYGSVEYEDKIFSDITHVVIGASGVVGLFDKFRGEISRIAKEKPDMEPSVFISEAEKTIHRLNTEYLERTRGRQIDLLVAYGRVRIGQLQYITPSGVGEVVRRYQVIGSGEPYGSHLLKRFWRSDLTMKQTAVLGSLIIKHIEENELDEAVGLGKGDAQVWFIADWPPGAVYDKLSPEEQEALQTRQVTEGERAEIDTRVSEVYSKMMESFNKITI